MAHGARAKRSDSFSDEPRAECGRERRLAAKIVCENVGLLLCRRRHLSEQRGIARARLCGGNCRSETGCRLLLAPALQRTAGSRHDSSFTLPVAMS